MIFQQWSGVNAIIFNTVTIFNAANVAIDGHLATNIVGAVQLIATFSKFLNSFYLFFSLFVYLCACLSLSLSVSIFMSICLIL